MSSFPAHAQTRDDALTLHQRLLAGDPTAAHDLVDVYLDPLIEWLGDTQPSVALDVRVEAAEDALLALIRNPRSYSAHRQKLEVYLRLSAQGDLRNLLRKEQRHHRGRVSWASVEHSPQAGKYLGRDDDPSLPLRLAEETEAVAEVIPDTLRRELSACDRRALELIVGGERQTAVFAELWELQSLPPKEQSKEVKRRKDRLKVALKRAGGKS